MTDNEQTISFNDLMKEVLKVKFNSKERINYCGYRIFFSTAVDLLIKKQPEVLDEIIQAIRMNKNIKDNEIIECVSFYIDEPYYIQRIDENLYLFFYAEH